MRKTIQGFFSRFRKKNNPDPIAPRTMADSELEDVQKDPLSREEKAFVEKSFQKAQKENPVRH